jgi:ferredoxin
MSTEIYYFSGTGNSLVVARDLAIKLNGNLISIPSVMTKVRIRSDAEVIGIVFPVYFSEICGIPLIIQRFVEKLENLGSKYVFAVCTHKGGPSMTIEHFEKLLKLHGGNLASGFTVKMSVPYSTSLKMKRAFFHKDFNNIDTRSKDSAQLQKLYASWEKKLEVISNYVSGREEGRFETQGSLRKAIAAPYRFLMKFMYSIRYKQLAEASHLPFNELIHLADKSFQVNEKCNGCGICARICPVSNIEMVHNRPVWQHHCENCIACFQWCPRGAIHGEIVAYEKKYHHPNVKLSDMLTHNGSL